MDLETITLSFLKYGILPLLTVLCTVMWNLFKKHEARLDSIEQRASETEKAVIEIKTEFKFISRDIKEIKEILIKLGDK